MAFILPLFILLGSACTSTPDIAAQSVFKAPYTTVWKAVLLAMQPYPIKSENLEEGHLVTKIVKGYSVWEPPPGAIKNRKKKKYRIKVFLEQGDSNSEAVKVHIVKEEFISKDFIKHSEPTRSTGLEEQVILYRIQRGIFLERAKKRFFKEQKARKKEIESADHDEFEL